MTTSCKAEPRHVEATFTGKQGRRAHALRKREAHHDVARRSLSLSPLASCPIRGKKHDIDRFGFELRRTKTPPWTRLTDFACDGTRNPNTCTKMTRSQALAPCLALLLGSAVVLEGFLPAPLLIPARHNAVSRRHHRATSVQEHPHHQTRTRSTADHNHDDSFAKTTTATLSMARSSPGGNASGARGWIATLLCAAALLSGPDVVQMENQQQGLPSLLRPPIASALSEEQVWPKSTAARTKGGPKSPVPQPSTAPTSYRVVAG